MVRKLYRIIIVCWGLSCCLLSGNQLLGCGWNLNEETIRVSMFRAELGQAASLKQFLYTPTNYYDPFSEPDQTDRKRNCQEWQERLDSSIPLDDIDSIVYRTSSALFTEAYKNQSLARKFAGNKFIAELVQEKNAEILKYLAFAKQIEQHNKLNAKGITVWESWSSIHSFEVYEEAETDVDLDIDIAGFKDPFLRERYAFLLIRLNYYLKNSKQVIALYDQYFERVETKSVLKAWALYFKASVLEPAERDYLFSLVMDQCYEKRFIILKRFNRDPEMLEKTLAFAKNDRERSNILSMALFRNPAPVLPQLKRIQSFDPDPYFFSFLLTREINKLEDWIFTPMLTQYRPTVVFDATTWYEDFENAKKTNYEKDMVYLRELKEFVVSMHTDSKGVFKNYLAMAAAHLSFIDDEVEEGKKYMENLSQDAHPTILAQQAIEAILLELKSGNIHGANSQQAFTRQLTVLEQLADKHVGINKSLYSVLRLLANEYVEKEEYAYAGLLMMKSDQYSKLYNYRNYAWFDPSDYYQEWDYSDIAYFDRFANTEDMDKLISVLERKNKSKFEAYLCDQKLADVNTYKELAATLAFRKNDLKKTAAYLSQIPNAVLNKPNEYNRYLNEDPFVPKAFTYVNDRDYTYKFRKKDFINRLIALEEEANTNSPKAADNYLLLGHAYFNCSYWGNAWAMVNYGWSNSEKWNTYHEYEYGSMYEMKKVMQEGNYYYCTKAKEYYIKAFGAATNDEQRAMASLMLTVCNHRAYIAREEDKEYGERFKQKFKAGQSVIDLYTKYRNTEVFRTLSCTTLDNFYARAN